MATTVDQLEREKYILLEKVKNLEIAKSMAESDSKRKDDRCTEMAQKVTQLTTKLNSYREKSKAEQKSICSLFRKFGKILKKVQEANQGTIEYITKIMQGLSLQLDYDLPQFSLFDPKTEFAAIFDNETIKSFPKIEFGKLQSTIMTEFIDRPNYKETGRLYESTYRTLLGRMENCQTSAHELASLKNNFEDHKTLMKDTNALLRGNTMRGSMDLSSSRVFNGDDSNFMRSSFRLDESIVGCHNESFRATADGSVIRRHGERRLSVLDESVIDGEPLLILDDTPRKKKVINFDDQ